MHRRYCGDLGLIFSLASLSLRCSGGFFCDGRLVTELIFRLDVCGWMFVGRRRRVHRVRRPALPDVRRARLQFPGRVQVSPDVRLSKQQLLRSRHQRRPHQPLLLLDQDRHPQGTPSRSLFQALSNHAHDADTFWHPSNSWLILTCCHFHCRLKT